MELYYSLSVFIVIASFFAYFNVRFLKLPSTIGIMVIAMVASIVLVTFGNAIPTVNERISSLLERFDFTEVLMGAMLNFMLFAGAIHVSLRDLREQSRPILTFSTITVVISTLAVGTLVYFIPIDGLEIPFLYCLLFGALISPTDPVAVLSILKEAKVRKSLETKIAGESLFNDGMAVVLFAVLLQLAQGRTEEFTVLNVLWLLIREAGGGLLLGVALGVGASKAIRKIDDYKVTILITLSVVMGGYLIARALHVSGPLTMVFAGLIIGNFRKRWAMSATTKDYLDKFWELNDEILNAILFLFIGFNLLLIPDLTQYWLPGLACVIIVLLSRLISIWLPTRVITFKEKITRGTINVLVWGGLRGGVSIALALSIDDNPYKKTIIAITYFVVVFSIIVQGLTIGKVANRVLAKS
ncbi:sodium:proton antiporter [Flavobacterium coralii]|uniref:cation:proton antiporter n=1 Tax=Flavobacterium coralii TaxID=2838017 RepID=UPI000C663FDA|nr:sodium:proton antiporter [Flavobacterium sp.]|tara:strand:- start:23310 stop:24548 length:1239 start_codon:yes stop_codon:yes gene_type:complete